MAVSIGPSLPEQASVAHDAKRVIDKRLAQLTGSDVAALIGPSLHKPASVAHELGNNSHMRPACFILPAKSPASSPRPQK